MDLTETSLPHLTLLALSLAIACAACGDEPVRFGPAGGLRTRSTGTLAGECALPKGADSNPAACPSWANDIFPMMQQRYNCTLGGCHLAPSDASGVNMVPDDPAASYQALAAFTNEGRPYIQENDKDDGTADAYILCNLDREATLTIGTIMPDGIAMTAEDLALIGNWVACGMIDDSAGSKAAGQGGAGGGAAGQGGSAGAGGN